MKVFKVVELLFFLLHREVNLNIGFGAADLVNYTTVAQTRYTKLIIIPMCLLDDFEKQNSLSFKQYSISI